MKKSFSGFYNPTDEEIADAWRHENTVFIFDTNVLLDIYSYKEITRKDFFSSLEKLKGNIWIPFHVGLEYQRNRLEIISKAKAAFRHAKEELNSIKSLETKNKIKSITDMFPSLLEKTSKLSKDIDKLISDYENDLNELDEKQPCVRSHDKIREKLNDLFCDKVGAEPSQDKIDAIEKDGEERYKNKIPPGFCDESNKKDECFYYGGVKYKKKYGDLIIWKQIIEYLESNKNINNVIFITNDLKRDWWYIIDSGGQKRIGPHALLINEIKKLDNIKLFDMYTAADFLRNTSEYSSDFDISDESISNVKEIEIRNKSHKTKNALSIWEKLELELNAWHRLNNWYKLDNIDKLLELQKDSTINEKIKRNTDFYLAMQKNNDTLKRWMQLNEAINLYNTARVDIKDSDFPEYENSNMENIQSDVISIMDEEDKE
jgi:hypothetical protein